MSRPRLTGGRARGRSLAHAVREGVRPTSSRVREALFSIVGQDLQGARILDAFGGTGLLGLEAWSRGAAVVVVERDPRTAREISANAEALGATVEVRIGDVLAVAPELGRFDGILVDPPYRDLPGPIVERLASSVDDWLVLEAEERTEAPIVGSLEREPRRSYGGTALWVYRRAAG